MQDGINSPLRNAGPNKIQTWHQRSDALIMTFQVLFSRCDLTGGKFPKICGTEIIT